MPGPGPAVRLKATIVTYNTLMSACGKAGMFDTVQDLFEDMQDKGIQPDAFTLTALITACNHEVCQQLLPAIADTK